MSQRIEPYYGMGGGTKKQVTDLGYPALAEIIAYRIGELWATSRMVGFSLDAELHLRREKLHRLYKEIENLQVIATRTEVW